MRKLWVMIRHDTMQFIALLILLATLVAILFLGVPAR